MELYNFLYQQEHINIPNKFYQDPKSFFETYLQDENGIYEILCKDLTIEFPYKENDFKTEQMKAQELDVIKVTLPLPEKNNEALCRYIYFAFKFDDKTKQIDKCYYFTVEKSLFGYMLCGWKNQRHNNFGEIKLPDNVFNEIQLLRTICAVFEKL